VTGRQLMLGQANGADSEDLDGHLDHSGHSSNAGHAGHAGLTDDSGHSDHSDHMHAGYDARLVRDRPAGGPAPLVQFLTERPEGAYRIKGFINFGVTGHRQRYVLHAVGRYLRFSRSPWPAGQSRHTALEIIGSGLDRGALGLALGSCGAPGARRRGRDAGRDPVHVLAP